MKRTKPVSEIYHEFEEELVSFIRDNHDEDLNIDDFSKKSYSIILKETYKLVYKKYKNHIIFRDVKWFQILGMLEGLPKQFKILVEKEDNYLNLECILPRTIYNVDDTDLSGEIKEEVIRLF